jgi:NADPH2:quinone reductase
MPETMKAMRFHTTGGPEVFRFEDVPVPGPGEGQVLVRLRASGVNFVDIYHRRGDYPPPGGLPCITGQEAAGVVAVLGPGVTGLKAGDRVTYAGAPGSYAEYAVVPAWRLVPVPAALSFDQAAALMLQGMTAHYLLHTTHPTRAGEIVLVHSAAGGVGLLAVQMAKMLGARVIGTVSTPEKARLAKEAGADDVINYSQTDFAEEVKRITNGRGVDLVLDAVGKPTFLKGLDALTVRGHMVVYGRSGGAPDALPPTSLMTKGITLTGSSLVQYARTREETLERAGAVMNWVAQGRIKLTIHKTLPLAQAAEAHRLLENRQTVGKLVLTIA